MNATGQLRRDHTWLRQSLILVEETLHVGAPAWLIFEEACVDLAARLEQHIAREEPLRIRYLTRGARIGAARRNIPHHKHQAHQLRVILRHLIVRKDVLPKDVDAALYAMVEDLHQQMEAQEQQLLPTMAQVQEAKPAASPVASDLNEPAAVNHLNGSGKT